MDAKNWTWRQLTEDNPGQVIEDLMQMRNIRAQLEDPKGKR